MCEPRLEKGKVRWWGLMMGSDMIVMVTIHHGDTLYHDQGDMAPLPGTYIIYFASYILFGCWKSGRIYKIKTEPNFITAHDMTFLSNFLSRGSHWADGCDQTVSPSRDTWHVTRDTWHQWPQSPVSPRLLIDIRHPQTCDGAGSLG